MVGRVVHAGRADRHAGHGEAGEGGGPAAGRSEVYRVLGIERQIQIELRGSTTERAQLDALSLRNKLAQLRGGEKHFFRRERDVISQLLAMEPSIHNVRNEMTITQPAATPSGTATPGS